MSAEWAGKLPRFLFDLPAWAQRAGIVPRGADISSAPDVASAQVDRPLTVMGMDGKSVLIFAADSTGVTLQQLSGTAVILRVDREGEESIFVQVRAVGGEGGDPGGVCGGRVNGPTA